MEMAAVLAVGPKQAICEEGNWLLVVDILHLDFSGVPYRELNFGIFRGSLEGSCDTGSHFSHKSSSCMYLSCCTDSRSYQEEFNGSCIYHSN